MNFVIELLVTADGKSDSYNSIFVIIDQFTKMAYYKPVKVTINISGFAKVIIDIVIWYYNLPDSIMSD